LGRTRTPPVALLGHEGTLSWDLLSLPKVEGGRDASGRFGACLSVLDTWYLSPDHSEREK